MKCPHCNHIDSRVLDTRDYGQNEIRRRRECNQCKTRFYTIESLLVAFPQVVKKDGRRETFSKEKLRRGIQIACKKRPVSVAQIESLVNLVANWTLNVGKKELNSHAIGQIVVKELQSLDNVAYIRFASVYKTFCSINEFVESLGRESLSSPEDSAAKAPAAETVNQWDKEEPREN